MLRSRVAEVRTGHNRLLAKLSVAEYARLAPFLQDVALENAHVLASANEVIDAVWFPQDAVLSTVITMGEGDAIEVGLLGCEGMTGLGLLFGDRTSPVTVNVLIRGSAVRMRANDFVREVVLRDGEARQLLLRFAGAFMAVVSQIAACNGSHTVEQRLARWLAMAADRTGDDRFPLTQDFMARMIGVRRASVTAVAGTLRAIGAIEYAKGWVHVLDRPHLEARACECYAIMRDRIEAVFA